MRLSRLFAKSKQEDTDERLELLEKAIRRMEEEWTDVYAKFRTLQMRVAKQVQRLDKLPEEGSTQPDGGSVSPTTLSPKAQLIKQQIEAHRRANGG